jgi:hypothetical protein
VGIGPVRLKQLQLRQLQDAVTAIVHAPPLEVAVGYGQAHPLHVYHGIEYEPRSTPISDADIAILHAVG